MKKILPFASVSLFIAALSVLWFVAGCASSTSSTEALKPRDKAVSKWNAAVEKHIPDTKRADQLKQTGHRLIELADAIQSDVDSLNRKLMDLNENYDSTDEQLQQLLDAFSQKRNSDFAQYKQILFSMRGIVSAEEWKHLTKQTFIVKGL